MHAYQNSTEDIAYMPNADGYPTLEERIALGLCVPPEDEPEVCYPPDDWPTPEQAAHTARWLAVQADEYWSQAGGKPASESLADAEREMRRAVRTASRGEPPTARPSPAGGRRMPANDAVLTIADVAALTGLSRRHVERAREAGRLKGGPKGCRAVRFTGREVRKWIEAGSPARR